MFREIHEQCCIEEAIFWYEWNQSYSPWQGQANSRLEHGLSKVGKMFTRKNHKKPPKMTQLCLTCLTGGFEERPTWHSCVRCRFPRWATVILDVTDPSYMEIAFWRSSRGLKMAATSLGSSHVISERPRECLTPLTLIVGNNTGQGGKGGHMGAGSDRRKTPESQAMSRRPFWPFQPP